MEDYKLEIYKITKILSIALMAVTLLSGATALLCGIRFQEAFILTWIAFGAVAYLLNQKKKKMEALRQIRINDICSQIQAYIADSVSNGQWISGIPKSSAKILSFQSTDHPDIHQVNILIGVQTENRQALTSEDALLLQEIIQKDMNEIYSGVTVRKPYYDSTLESDFMPFQKANKIKEKKHVIRVCLQPVFNAILKKITKYPIKIIERK